MTPHPPAQPEHDETPRQRLARNYGEQLQEVRVAQTAVQFLLAFLLALAFTPRFPEITAFQQDVYVIALVLGASATALLIAPAAYHRLVFRRGLKDRLVRATALFTLSGLTVLMLAIGASLLLVLDVVIGGPRAVWLTGAVLGWFGLWWFAVPLWTRRHGRQPD
ncbi:DUF6328 family protein [Actinokineospora soli]|uniref:DUF6328 family protein n=1 Tax=Actinokineospora soli TaxID=1048753 RepID=A0ABW2TSW3_9PSEU